MSASRHHSPEFKPCSTRPAAPSTEDAETRYRTLSIITTTIVALALIVFVAFLLVLKALLVILLIVGLVVALLWALTRRSS